MRVIISVVVLSALFLMCSKGKDEESGCYSKLINPEMTKITRDGKSSFVKEKKAIKPGDTIDVYEGGTSLLRLSNGTDIQMDENTSLTYACTKKERISGITLITGEVVVDNTKSSFDSVYTVSTKNLRISGDTSAFYAAYYSKSNVTVVKSFCGDLSISVTGDDAEDEKNIKLPECRKMMVKGDKKRGQVLSVTDKDKSIMKMAFNRIDFLKGDELCTCKQGGAPPEWDGVPDEICYPGELFLDTLRASDPEGGEVRYSLIKNPKGMSVSEETGIISFRPETPGTYQIIAKAADSEGESVRLRYHLTAVGNLDAVIETDKVAEADHPVKIDASRSVNSEGTRDGLQYRFDIDSDGTWDVPETGKYGSKSVITHTYSDEGEYVIKAEIIDRQGRTAQALDTLRIYKPLGVDIVFTPEFGSMGDEYTLKAEVKEGDSGEFAYRWDLNGDRLWDVPSDKEFSEEAGRIKQVWEEPGLYEVTCSIRDSLGDTATVTAGINVYTGVEVDSVVSPDTGFVGEEITTRCFATDPDFRITEYKWDLGGTGVFAEKTKSHSLSTTYRDTGKHTVICCAVNEKGMVATGSSVLTVADRSHMVSIDAGGPYQVSAGDTALLKGSVQGDAEINSWSWDLNNDSRSEIESASPEAKYLFTDTGKHKIVLRAEDASGNRYKDSAFVTVKNMPPKADAGERILAEKGDRVELKGSADDPEGSVRSYEWDFDNDGEFDYRSEKSGEVKHRFDEYTTSVLRVTDAGGAVSTDSVVVVICPDDMAPVEEGKFCIDRFEWPNQAGKKPLSGITWKEAAEKCESRGKRLCTENEMRSACRGGRERRVYPYGRDFKRDNCNTLENRHVKNSKAVSRDFPDCTTRDGVFDMTGNVAEWTSSGNGGMKRVHGGWWQSSKEESKCGSTVKKAPDREYFHIGFRCCM
ncbi:MAG: PKD domain-containing protein [Chitinivibrionales bacterium]